MKSIFSKFFLLAFLSLWASCSSTQQDAIQSKSSNPSDIVAVQSKDKYEKGEEATFIIKNKNKEKDVLLFQPKKILVERQTEKGWERVNIRYCPCGASCPPPPEWEKLKSQSTKEVKWDLNEEWCGEINAGRKVPETKRKYAGAGIYRFVLRYSMDKGKEISTNYRTFELK